MHEMQDGVRLLTITVFQMERRPVAWQYGTASHRRIAMDSRHRRMHCSSESLSSMGDFKIRLRQDWHACTPHGSNANEDQESGTM